MDAAQSSSEIGRKLRQLRHSRGKSLDVVAGLAGISKSYLSMVECGKRALDRRSVIVALANALEVAPSELTTLPVSAPGNGGTDTAVKAVSQVLMAVHFDEPDGRVTPVEVLQGQLRDLIDYYRACQMKKVGAALPGLIRDVHTSIAAGRNVAELLDLAVPLHTLGTIAWLQSVGAGVDLRLLAALAGWQAAQRRDDPAMLGISAFGGALVALAAGNINLARTRLDSVTVPTSSQDGMELAGVLMLCRSLVAAADRRPADVEAALGEAAELAGRTGEGDAYSLGFGPTNVGLFSMAAALESGDHERTVTIAERLDPRVHPSRSRQSAYWMDYGRALAHIRGRHDDAVMALRHSERISSIRTLRNPYIRDVLAELLTRAKRDAVGRELRGLAYRAGLPV